MYKLPPLNDHEMVVLSYCLHRVFRMCQRDARASENNPEEHVKAVKLSEEINQLIIKLFTKENVINETDDKRN